MVAGTEASISQPKTASRKDRKGAGNSLARHAHWITFVSQSEITASGIRWQNLRVR